MENKRPRDIANNLKEAAGKLDRGLLGRVPDTQTTTETVENPTRTQTPLLDAIRGEKAAVVRRFEERLNELNSAERRLLNSDAEIVIRESERVLYKEF